MIGPVSSHAPLTRQEAANDSSVSRSSTHSSTGGQAELATLLLRFELAENRLRNAHHARDTSKICLAEQAVAQTLDALAAHYAKPAPRV